ncbi:MAG: dihydroorotase [Aphanocapsa sp. GSE-SYN-MK-11-07L]|jgi:dihydroorotase|nr:dihydroorotase [Aphanocapsa sp. GSE-SYN-MK-11-07L]
MSEPWPNQLLQNVRILDPVSQTDRFGDVWLSEGTIQAVAAQIMDWPEQTQIRDGQGLILGPGLIDLYSHSGQPGYESRETLASLGQAAIAGGFTRLTLLPDTLPVLDQPSGLEWLQAHIDPNWPLRWQTWAALTQGLKGEQMTELAELAAAGALGFSDGQPLNNLALVRRSLEYLKPLNCPVALWACDRTLAGEGVMREGIDSLRFGLPGTPAIAETSALAALLELIAVVQTPVHLMRVSTARSVALLAVAKAEGLPITASTTWMHLLLDTTAIASYNPHLRVEPPLGQPSDRLALIDGIKSGVIDAIAIDHTPYTYEEKTVPFAEAPPGAIGLELALPLLWQHLVETQALTGLELWQALSTRPSQCLGQATAAIAAGQVAELTLFDPQRSGSPSKSLSKNTPWQGDLTGQVVQTWCGRSSAGFQSASKDPKR